jgi:D-arabinose 1-dehydrogenase-like Zn-dependent alcohol dehydrogenase
LAIARYLSKRLGHRFDDMATVLAFEVSRPTGPLELATSAQAMSATLAGLKVNGKLLVMGVPGDKLQVSPFILFTGRRAIEGVNTGTAIDAADTLAFSLLANVRPMNEVFPFKQAPLAYRRMLDGARFRAVLDMTNLA